MVVRIAGRRMYLWRAVDHEGEVLDMLVQLQVSSIRPALPQHPCRRPQHIQSSTTPYLPIDAEVLSSRSDGAVATCRRNGMKPDPSVSHSRLETVTVTT